MQLKAMKVFCDVVRQRSFSRAADENHISQSAASQLVQHLEEELEVKLIDRSRRPFVLTPEGDIFFEGCCELVEKCASLEDRVRTLHQQVVGQVRVAAIYSIGLHQLNDYIQTFMARFPQANVRLEYLHPSKVYKSIETDTADLGLVSYPKSSRGVDAIHWRDEPMVLVCSPSHPFATSHKTIPFSALSGQNMVSFDEDLTIRREIDKALSNRKILVENVMVFDNIETIKRAVEINVGISLLPAPTVQHEVNAGTLVAIPFSDERLVRPIGIIHRRGKELSNTALRYIELLQIQDDLENVSSTAEYASSSLN